MNIFGDFVNFITTAPMPWRIPFVLCLLGAAALYAFAPRPPQPPSKAGEESLNTSQSVAIVNSPNASQQIIQKYYAAPKPTNEDIAIENRIASFIATASPIREKLLTDRSDAPWIEAKAWETEVADYLNLTRPPLAAVFASAQARSARAYRNTSVEQSRRIVYLEEKVESLRQILLK